jgi:hypothetical protein
MQLRRVTWLCGAVLLLGIVVTGCDSSKGGGGTKPPADTQLKPLPDPKSPGDGGGDKSVPKGKPGAGPVAQ